MHAFIDDKTLIIIFEKGEKLIERLTRFCEQENISAGTISAIGALENVTLGFFHTRTKSYDKKILKDEHELLSLVGNVSLGPDRKPFVHCHAVLGKDDFQTLGGHLFEGTVAVTVEMRLDRLDGALIRNHSDDFDLNLIEECR
ncbi:MAG: DNA-binding protein [Planctomycetes bacterium]|nr:DNA-binding protein [Planctomycetota bacterium]